jgi:putative beta-lysine N-acetyltransferase
MTDKTEIIGNSPVSHGKFSDRAYILSFSQKDGADVIEHVEKLAKEGGYSKIIAKVPKEKSMLFKSTGYSFEAVMPLKGTYTDEIFFAAKYLKPERESEQNIAEQAKIIAAAISYKDKKEKAPEVSSCRRMAPADAEEMAAVYRQVFESYPFPIHNPDYIRETMREDVAYFGIYEEEKLAALSSAEFCKGFSAAEMTDFATLPEFRGRGCANSLLAKMEEEVPKLGIRNFFTIARAMSYGMNITFARNGYDFSGRLVNNTNICGSIESMNVWYKQI